MRDKYVGMKDNYINIQQNMLTCNKIAIGYLKIIENVRKKNQRQISPTCDFLHVYVRCY